MSQSKPTPGPWEVSQSLPGVDTDEIVSSHDACWIARVQRHKNCIATCDSSANARLIAAAPDLLEIARMAAWETYPRGHRVKMTILALDALAKAEGE